MGPRLLRSSTMTATLATAACVVDGLGVFRMDPGTESDRGGGAQRWGGHGAHTPGPRPPSPLAPWPWTALRRGIASDTAAADWAWAPFGGGGRTACLWAAALAALFLYLAVRRWGPADAASARTRPRPWSSRALSLLVVGLSAAVSALLAAAGMGDGGPRTASVLLVFLGATPERETGGGIREGIQLEEGVRHFLHYLSIAEREKRLTSPS